MSQPKPVPFMTADEMEALVRKAVRDELNAAGLRLDEPEHQDEAREDFRFLRKMRRSMDGAASKVGYTILLSIAGGVIWLITQGANAWRGG
jgi:hypothetical protein